MGCLQSTHGSGQGRKDGFNIIRTNDNAYIPFDEANTDYQAFLRWCEEGNTPLPADAP